MALNEMVFAIIFWLKNGKHKLFISISPVETIIRIELNFLCRLH